MPEKEVWRTISVPVDGPEGTMPAVRLRPARDRRQHRRSGWAKAAGDILYRLLRLRALQPRSFIDHWPDCAGEGRPGPDAAATGAR